ncbi:protein kinase [Mycobacterium sp. ITM-2016-00316]|uniref:protein kinase domain-containing protein n=1 Tax=Mycobacterium sp. ITM-2016-00316 TaxID=2099695 RepID=UPI000CF8C723|nr:protein kinase [Mycobacterium sp. ITM-2016-00316]WNG81150.1 protein kinase [Mycobacterium sp. ITM-2016-00316]
MAEPDDRATRRDSAGGTARDGRHGTARDGGRGTTRDGASSRREFGILLPDYLAADYNVIDDLPAGSEAAVAVVQHRDTGHVKVVKIYRQGITLPQAFIDKLETADARHVLPVQRSVYTGWASPRFIEVMDFVSEGSLAKLLSESGGGIPDRARRVLEEMTDALDYVHDRLEMVHRDIKPANILIRRQEPLDLVLADLGIASELDEVARSRRETTGSVKGTPEYQAPETLHTNDAGRARDWWALGMTMCEVLTGQHPFKDSAGNPLRDHGRIGNAIALGDIDLSIVTDDRWNLLCRGLLTHHPDDRWGASQVRSWLAGETPSVVSRRRGATPRAAGSFRFAGRSFTDPESLADHMVTSWRHATDLFTSPPECEALRTWIREDVRDNDIATNLLTPVGGSSTLADARIIAFTSHFRPGKAVFLRDTELSAADLASRFARAGDAWKGDSFLKLLQPKVVDAVVECHFNPEVDQRGQSAEYRALAQYSRYVTDIDREITSAAAAVSQACTAHVEGVDIGADVRQSMPSRIDRAQGLARALLLSPASVQEVWGDFGLLDRQRPRWFADLCAQVGDPTSTRNIDVPGSIARLALATVIADLATLYEHAWMNAKTAADQRRREAEAAAEVARYAELRAERHRVAIMAGIGAAASLVGLFVHIWLAPQFSRPDTRDWMNDAAHNLLHRPSADMQELALGLCAVALMGLALTALFSVVDINALRTVTICLCALGAICILPMVIIAVGMILMIVFGVAVVALIAVGLMSAAS